MTSACICEGQSGIKGRIQAHETRYFGISLLSFFFPQLLKCYLCARQYARSGELKTWFKCLQFSAGAVLIQGDSGGKCWGHLEEPLPQAWVPEQWPVNWCLWDEWSLLGKEKGRNTARKGTVLQRSGGRSWTQYDESCTRWGSEQVEVAGNQVMKKFLSWGQQGAV